jgi:hypothetical protein
VCLRRRFPETDAFPVVVVQATSVLDRMAWAASTLLAHGRSQTREALEVVERLAAGAWDPLASLAEAAGACRGGQHEDGCREALLIVCQLLSSKKGACRAGEKTRRRPL